MPAPVNEKLDLAHQFVLHTNRNVFLTGKAGTGKTTFLHQIKQLSAKRLVVVAPTGVAAINAGGVTIHSLFQLPFGPLAPGVVQREGRHFNRDKIKLIRTLDLLVIDEISMVRADVLDGIDVVLRRYRNSDKPFGGVQLLLIGDMQQLPPVIRDDDWTLLSPHYDTGYFFGSRALSQTPYVAIELTHIYRQSDQRFITLLNGIREKTITASQLADLNQRYIPDFNPADDEGYITLSTHNHAALAINAQKLTSLKRKSYRFAATVTGEFPAHAYPTEADLELKVGAQVMFIKNDISREKLFYNGKIGRIVDIDEEGITVQSDGEEIEVGMATWENIRYSLDTATKEIKGEVIGQFAQFPLKLAWAITIHKSQGLTFEKAIIDASSAFAHGQVYVALSRCKTLGGLVLKTPIPSHSIKNEPTLADFHEQVQQQTPSEQHLHEAKRYSQALLVQELFSFEEAHSFAYRCRRVANEHAGSLAADLMPMLTQLSELLTEKARDVSRRFVAQLPQYVQHEQLPETNEPLQERIKKAGSYFKTLLGDELLPLLHRCPIDTDNKQVREALHEAIDDLDRELFGKLRAFAVVQEGFDALTYLQARNRAELDYKPARKKTESSSKNDEDKGGLYGVLVKWRNDLAGENNVEGFRVLPQKTLFEIAKIRPRTTDELLAINGFGRAKVRQIGTELLAIINGYSERSSPVWKEKKEKKPKKEKEVKTPSATVTLMLFQAGKSIADIATERSLATSTIESHLAECIRSGDLSVEAVLPANKLNAIQTYLETNPGKTLGESRHGLGENVTYSEIRFVYNAMRAAQGAVDE